MFFKYESVSALDFDCGTIGSNMPTEERLSFSSRSCENLEEIIRYCHGHEHYLRDLARQTRRERKKAERLLRETSQRKQSEAFFIAFDDHKAKQHARRSVSTGQRKAHRVRFHTNGDDDEQPMAKTRANENDDDLTRRCDDLLSRLQIQRHRAAALEKSSLVRSAALTARPAAVTHLQHALEHLRPLKYQDMHGLSINNSSQIRDRLQASPVEEIRRRNYLREQILRIRLRQHALSRRTMHSSNNH